MQPDTSSLLIFLFLVLTHRRSQPPHGTTVLPLSPGRSQPSPALVRWGLGPPLHDLQPLLARFDLAGLSHLLPIPQARSFSDRLRSPRLALAHLCLMAWLAMNFSTSHRRLEASLHPLVTSPMANPSRCSLSSLARLQLPRL
jgi:hypothetical protein